MVGVVSSYILQPKGMPDCWRGSGMRVHRRNIGWQSVWQSANRESGTHEKKYCDLRRLRRVDGHLGAVRDALDDEGNTLGPYSVAVFLTLGALLSCFVWNIYFMKQPLVGEPVSLW